MLDVLSHILRITVRHLGRLSCLICLLCLNIKFVYAESFITKPSVTKPAITKRAKIKSPLIVKHVDNHYFRQVIELALAKSKPIYGDYQIELQEHIGSKERMRRLLQKGSYVDVLWSTTSTEREKQLKPVKFSLLKKLNQYRILVLSDRETVNAFESVNTLSDLRAFTASSGTHWQDTKVFERNKLPMVTTVKFASVFSLLRIGRVDYVARGAYELSRELKQGYYSGLYIDSRLMLKYGMDYYFFVHPDNDELHDRLLSGLQIAQADGSFDKLFFSFDEYKEGWDRVHNHQRKLILLQD
ncbi:transporter substrate-binding domain-containing protein [Algibacillus agarilyticus]|uniref:transporter substrate-binding domain-containing protein n=1 Tax=Algibacillus agarilyticus TaxID=2234133 RepID=UPI000DD088AB|nr:transporter substrate-binding domain-containing protein [Algibacillus agarilyticus]